MNKFLLPLFILITLATNAQRSYQFTIDSCYKLATNNYPLIKRAALIDKSNEYSLSNIQKGYLPQIIFGAQGTYQSDVTSISIPIVKITPPSKDQYKATVDVNENIYDGGVIVQQKKIQRASSALETANLKKDLYDIRQRINQLYFGALLLDAQLKQNDLLIKELKDTKERVDATIKNGATYKTDGDAMQAEILTQQQRNIEIQAGIENYLSMLSAFIGKKVDNSSHLVVPNIESERNSAINRPELAVFDSQNQLYNHQLTLIDLKSRPKLSAFAEGGYGKPGLNLFKNEFSLFYIGGLKLSWSPSAYYTSKNEKLLMENNLKNVDIQKETFLFNNNLERIQENSEQQKLNKYLESDDTIISLKEKVKASAKAKYENGVITLNDLLKEIDAVEQAKLNKEVHQLKLLINQFTNKFTMGN